MKKLIAALAILTCRAIAPCAQTVTIEDCVSMAEANYPVVSKYALLEATRDIDLGDINRSWLPRIDVYGQLTGQNVVPTFPETLTGVLNQMGQSVRGLGKIQYKIGADVTQPIWDGGASSARRDAARAGEAVSRGALDAELYAVRQRVESIYFAILLTDEQTAQSEVTYNLLLKNVETLQSMVRNGVAMQSDVDMVEAQALVVKQNITRARSAAAEYRKALELFTGRSLEGVDLVCPAAEMPATDTCARPELQLFERRMSANRALDRLYDAALMPKVGFFAQAYYGYPGYNYFNSMMTRELSFNIMAGVKVTWNIDSFYTNGNNRRRTELSNLEVEADRDIFLFNNNIQSASQSQAIAGLRELMADDARIITLRANVRRAAESQLANGVIDTTALLGKITDEYLAQLTARLHEIQLIQEIYNLKYILNR